MSYGGIQEIDKAEEYSEISLELIQKRDDLKTKLRMVLNDEASMYRTRAKQHWLREGDGNTKYFHSMANGRRRANGIGTIVEDDAVYQTDEEIKTYFFHNFRERFNLDEKAPSSFGKWSELFTSNRVTAPNLTRITEPFTTEEIKQVVFQLGSDKAPGPYSFPLIFYQTFWDTLQEDILIYSRNCMREGCLLHQSITLSYV